MDLDRLQDEAYHPTALTNIKGRVVANGWCHLRDSQTLDWVLHESLSERVLAFMAPYLAFAKTDVERRADDHLILGVSGGDQQMPGIRIVSTAAALEQLLERHVQIEASRWRLDCIDAGIVLVEAATAEKFLPQMLGLVATGAVDFDKGCYLGQEVVARAQHRGQVKRGLVCLAADADAVDIVPGKALSDSTGRESGVVVMAAELDAERGQHRCLGITRISVSPDAAETASTYLCGSTLLSRVDG